MLTGKKVEGRKIRHLRIRDAGDRHRGAAAAGRVPEPEPHLRPGVDDTSGRTLAAVDSRAPDFRQKAKAGGNVAAAKIVGELLAQRAKARGISQVVFDRGGYQYHGRVKALADAARAAGLAF